MTSTDRAQTEAAVAAAAGHEWEMATDQLGTETRRSTLLIQPGRRYREQGEDRAGGCDGDRSWLAIREGDGWNVEADDGPEPPLPPMLRPSWLLTGYTLEAGEPVTVGEREALRLVATPRPGIWSRASAGTRPLDRVEMLVDAGLGILLRHEEILDGRTLSVTELTEVRLDPAPVDDDQFAPPGGWDSVPGSVPRAAPWGPGREAAKLFADLAAGSLARSSRSRSFEQATQEEPEAEMPPDPEPLPGDAPAVTDQLLHLLYDSRDNGASGFTATLHQWQDMAAILARVPDGVRRLGFGGLGHFYDAAGEQMATLHKVSRLSFDGSWRYRIEGSFRGGRAGSGPRRWSATGDGAGTSSGTSGSPSRTGRPPRSRSCSTRPDCSNTACPEGPRPQSDGRRGYRLRGRLRATAPGPAKMLFADDVVADTELGILLRLIYHAGSKPVSRWELRDVVVGASRRYPHRHPGGGAGRGGTGRASRPGRSTYRSVACVRQAGGQGGAIRACRNVLGGLRR